MQMWTMYYEEKKETKPMAEKIGKYKGYDVFKISLEDYLNFTDHARNDSNSIYIIAEDRYCFYRGGCIGKATQDWKNIKLTNSDDAIDYKIMYGSKIKNKTSPKSDVITERKTVETMAKSADKALKKSVAQVDALLNEDLGSNLLDSFYNQGQDLCKKVQVQGKGKG